MVMAITMVKDVFKRPHFQIKPTHIISRFLVPFLLIGIGILFYSSIQKGTLYEFPFSEEEIKEVNFFNILENDSVLVAYSGYGFFSDSSNKYSVHNLDLTRIWLRLFEGK